MSKIKDLEKAAKRAAQSRLVKFVHEEGEKAAEEGNL